MKERRKEEEGGKEGEKERGRRRKKSGENIIKTLHMAASGSLCVSSLAKVYDTQERTRDTEYILEHVE